MSGSDLKMDRCYHKILFGLALLMAAHSNAQSVDQWTAWGDAAFSKGEYYGASRYYDGALTADPGRMALQWKQAEACRLSDQYDKAHVLYDKVYRKDQGRTYTEALRWLGEMLLCDAQYKEAITVWKKLLRKEPTPTTFNAVRAKNALIGIELASATDTSNATIEHLPEPINSYSSEFAAQNGPDGKLYFTTLRGDVNSEGELQDTTNYNTSIVRAITNSLSESVSISSILDIDGDVGNCTWSADGKTILFTRCDISGPCAIWSANVMNGVYTVLGPVQGLPENATNTQPMLVSAGTAETLFFSSNAIGGIGGMDIWQARYVGGFAQHPKPLGEPVNTPGNERTPWAQSVEEKLWYSSDLLPGFGGYDIFTSTFLDNEYAAPVNAGKPWNSPANDLYPAFDLKTGQAFLTSNRKGSLAAKGETCCNDIYKIEVQKFSEPQEIDKIDSTTMIASVPAVPTPYNTSVAVTEVMDIVNQFPLKLYFDNDQPEPRSWATATSHTYGATYEEYKKRIPEYLRNGTDEKLTERFFIEEVDLGYSRLNELITGLEVALRNGEHITLDVRGHASPLAQNNYNVNLSTRRIESLRNHLRSIGQGVLAPYLDSTSASGGVLRIRQLPFGEDRSAHGVSDDLHDLEHSVYSVNAARERRIEIERIDLSQPPASKEPASLFFDVGTVRQGMEKRFSVPITNSGSLPLHINSARSECDCMQIGTLPVVIPPSGSATLDLIYTGRTRPGPLKRLITLTTNGTPPKLELIITGNVIE